MKDFEKNPNPTKDQHFMVDTNMLELIYDTADIHENEKIVEIGGGEGALTDYLIRGNNHVTVIEKDPYYAAYLKEKYKGVTNITVVEGDALEYDFLQYDRVVANLPYTITEPFLVNLAKTGALDYNPSQVNGSMVKSVTLVLYQNSVRKMVAPVQITEGGSRHANQEFGIMGTICKTMLDTDIICAIPSEAFFPEPAVTSFLVNLTPKKQKTTIDRIVKELLTDKKGVSPSIQRVYQLLLAQGKIYKLNKYKNNMGIGMKNQFTSNNIATKNIYELNNSQLSQLIQDLVRNDQSMKSRNSNGSSRHSEDFDIDSLFSGGKFNYDYDEIMDDYYDELERTEMEVRTKHSKNYDYLYDDLAYSVLLHRGLENLEPEVLAQMLDKQNSGYSRALIK